MKQFTPTTITERYTLRVYLPRELRPHDAKNEELPRTFLILILVVVVIRGKNADTTALLGGEEVPVPLPPRNFRLVRIHDLPRARERARLSFLLSRVFFFFFFRFRQEGFAFCFQRG